MSGTPEEPPGRPPRILVVEDEPLVVMGIEDAFDALGVQLVGPVGSVAQALLLVERGGLDGAFLDVNLRGQRCDAVADALAAGGIPFVFLTGHGPAGLPETHRARPVVAKPFRERDLADALARHILRG